MAGFTVHTDVYEGPFDLLLSLVSRQKLDVADVPVAQIADAYLEEVERMKDLDLDVASDFLLLAATLLQIKAASLLPREEPILAEEFEELSPEEARDILVARLLAYKQYKNVASELAARSTAVERMLPRNAALEERFLALMPDYLEGVTLRTIAVTCADLMSRREVFLLEAEHVAARPISLELHVDRVADMVRSRGRTRLSELLAADATPSDLVVTFLALLELYKRGAVDLVQDRIFGDIEVLDVSDEDVD
jgi:segregation and condensation protein A